MRPSAQQLADSFATPLDINLAGDGCAEGPCASHAPARASHAVESGIAPRRIYIWRHRRHKRWNTFPLRARPAYMQGRAQSARNPPSPESLVAIRRPQSCPRSSSEPHMCAECEDDAEGEIVLDTARGCAYYSILRQARKRLGEPRGKPAGGNLENRILDRRNHFLLSI